MAQDGPKMVSRWPQDGPKSPQEGPKRAPRWPQEAAGGPQEDLRGVQISQKPTECCLNISVRASPSAAGPLSIRMGYVRATMGCLGAVLKTCGNIVRGRMGIRKTYLNVGVTIGALLERSPHGEHEKPSRYDWGLLEAILGQSARLGLSSGSVHPPLFSRIRGCGSSAEFSRNGGVLESAPRTHIPIQKMLVFLFW